MEPVLWLVVAVAAIALVPLGIGLYARRFADGPVGPFAGGALRSGERIDRADVDWSFADRRDRVVLAELQLVEPLGSRTTGVMVHEGTLYVPCDLGFVWRRLPLRYRWLMHLVWSVKRWHEHALRDGRVVVRLGGKRYERLAVRETDPAVVDALKARSEAMADRFFSLPLAGPPSHPDAIWFFRLDPRPSE